MGADNPITSGGLAALRARYDHLLGTERPEIVAIVSWAAGNGDRSENGDYIYGRKRMREIDRELAHLARRMKAARVIDPTRSPTATAPASAHGDHRRRGRRAQDADAGRRRRAGRRGRPHRLGEPARPRAARRGVGDLRTVRLPGGEKEWEVVGIAYA